MALYILFKYLHKSNEFTSLISHLCFVFFPSGAFLAAVNGIIPRNFVFLYNDDITGE